MATFLSHMKLQKAELKLWFYAFVAMCAVFSPLLFNFIWGNHDWQPLLVDSRVYSGLLEGRFSQYFLLCLTLMGKILPVLNILLGFVLYSLALVLLYSRFFEFPLKNTALLPIIAAAILPYINEILYFQFIVFSQLSWPLVIALALLCCKKAAKEYALLYEMSTYVLLLFAVSGYPAASNLFVSAVALDIIIRSDSFKNMSKRLVLSVLPFLGAFLTLYVLHQWLISQHIMMSLYNNQTPGVVELIAKIFPMIVLSVQNLMQPQPFFSSGLKSAICLVLLLFVFYKLITEKTLKSRLFLILCFAGLLLCLKFSAWLTFETPENYFSQYDPAAFMVRTDFYAIPCLVLVCVAGLMNADGKLYKNAAVLMSVVLIVLSLKADFYFAKVHLFGFQTEALLQERINNRIQENEGYNPESLYTVVQAGELPARARFYKKSPLEKYGYYTLQIPYTRHWIAFEYYNFYAPKNFVREGTSINPQEITPKMIDFLSYKIDVWPSENAVYVDDTYAIIALTKNGKKMLTEQFRHVRDGF